MGVKVHRGKHISLLLVLLVAVSSVAPFFSSVDGDIFDVLTYGGTYTGTRDDTGTPIVSFSVENESVIYQLGKSSVGFTASVDAPYNLQTIMVALYAISYKASWEDKPTLVYRWSINDPANPKDDDPNPIVNFFYPIDLTNVPEGPQKVDVSVIGGGYVTDLRSYYTFEETATLELRFNITASTSSVTPSIGTWRVQNIT